MLASFVKMHYKLVQKKIKKFYIFETFFLPFLFLLFSLIFLILSFLPVLKGFFEANQNWCTKGGEKEERRREEIFFA